MRTYMYMYEGVSRKYCPSISRMCVLFIVSTSYTSSILVQRKVHPAIRYPLQSKLQLNCSVNHKHQDQIRHKLKVHNMRMPPRTRCLPWSQHANAPESQMFTLITTCECSREPDVHLDHNMRVLLRATEYVYILITTCESSRELHVHSNPNLCFCRERHVAWFLCDWKSKITKLHCYL